MLFQAPSQYEKQTLGRRRR